MALCTKCGAITNDADKNHVCDPADIPEPGKKHQPLCEKKNK